MGYALLGPPLTITASGRKHFTLLDDRLRCKNCDRMERRDSGITRLPNDDGLLMTIPIWISNPHICLFERLVQVEHYYLNKWIASPLYDRWMEFNGYDYQMGNSISCMRLWDEVNICSKELRCRTKPVGIDDELISRIDSTKWIKLVACRDKADNYHLTFNWGNLVDKKQTAVIDEIWRYSSEADAKKTNVSASHIIWHSRQVVDFRKNFNAMLPLLGLSASNVTATSIAIHCLGNPSVGKMIELIKKYRICCLNSEMFSNIFKLISVALRRSAHWFDNTAASLDEVAQCAGWELAIGRSVNVSDWAEEEKKRTSCRMFLGDPMQPKKDEEGNSRYCAELRMKLVEVLRPCFYGVPFTQSYEEFVKDRQSWVSSGSSGGEKMMIEGQSVKINKHVLFEKLESQEMIDWLNSEPKTVAVASEKYEMGKARAIYGTKPIDYTISAYVLNEIEPRMNLVEGIEAGLTGVDVISRSFHRKKVAQTANTECSMIDYADFNYQHTLEAQAAVFYAVADLFESVNAHSDKVTAARWTADALLNQWCRFPLSDEFKRVVQGMFSGCRATNFINTSSNVCYFRIAADWVAKHLRLHPVDLYNIHQGDDVWISNRSRLWAICIFKVMQSTGFDFQPKKQMFDICRAEFLRVLYSKEGCMGYLGRAVATLIMKPIQSAEINGPAERALSLSSQIQIIHRRGFTTRGADVLWKAVVPYAAHVNLPKGGFSIPVSVLRLHPKNGGLGLCPPGQYSHSVDVVPTLPTYQAVGDALAKCVPTNMSEDWIVTVSEKVRYSFDAEALASMVHKSNVTDSLRPQDKTAGLEVMEESLRKWKSRVSLPRVTCGLRLMEDFLSREAEFPVLERYLRDFEDGVMVKRNEKLGGVVKTINLAITLSPFKNISAASVSLKGDWVDIVRACLAMCSKPNVQAAAIASFNNMLSTVGAPVARAILDGQNIGVGFFEFKWHPVLLSWVSEMARERAALILMQNSVSEVSEARALVQSEFDNAIRALNKWKGMSEVSRY